MKKINGITGPKGVKKRGEPFILPLVFILLMASLATATATATAACSCSQCPGIPKLPFLSNFRRTPPFPVVSSSLD